MEYLDIWHMTITRFHWNNKLRYLWGCRNKDLISDWESISFHYNSVIMGAMASQITSLTIVYSTVFFFQAQIKEKTKLRVSGLCAGNSPVTGEFPAQMASYAENVSIWRRHHVIIALSVYMLCPVCCDKRGNGICTHTHTHTHCGYHCTYSG